MENKQTISITSHEVQEALEQVRAGFTVSRMALGAATITYPLVKSGKYPVKEISDIDKWAKKFTKVQNEYHKFLLDTYGALETLYKAMVAEEAENNKEENNEQ